ncbi:MAG: NAD(P)/FAD-dependent oxidoreductase [Acidobacteriaceae bacterium]|nr:NAD(P)/FAD-dependent oxidoreductase [Acidobacteriaceae bacterium]
MKRTAVVIGSGPNGLSAAIVLARAGLDVEVREAADAAGGAARSGELTLPGFVHDLGSAVHPMTVASPFFSKLRLENHGLRWIWSPAWLAHPFDDGSAIIVERDIRASAEQFGPDARAYRRLFEPLVRNWSLLASEVLQPLLHVPRHPVLLAKFGLRAIQPSTVLATALFRDARTRAFFAGIAAHSALTLEAPSSAAYGMILGALGHVIGWPIPRGGAQQITNALTDVLASLGGRVVTGSRVDRIDDLSGRDLVLCDITPRQFLAIAKHRLRPPFRQLLERYKYGPGAFKVDWALREPIPWKAKDCRLAATIHLGGSLQEIAASERAAVRGEAPQNPFILVVQPTLFDATRAPSGHHTAWAYCHVPNGWNGSALAQMEAQIERFAPGFRECILARAVHDPAAMQRWNANLVGGDVIGGAANLTQFVFRPTWRQYATPLKGVYFCSSSTPPGGSVHGMCGYWAAQWALDYLRKMGD